MWRYKQTVPVLWSIYVTWSFWISKLASSALKLSLDINDYQVSWGSGYLRFTLAIIQTQNWCKQSATTLPQPFKNHLPRAHRIWHPWPGVSHGCMETILTLGGGWDASWKIHLQIERSSPSGRKVHDSCVWNLHNDSWASAGLNQVGMSF